METTNQTPFADDETDLRARFEVWKDGECVGKFYSEREASKCAKAHKVERIQEINPDDEIE